MHPSMKPLLSQSNLISYSISKKNSFSEISKLS